MTKTEAGLYDGDNNLIYTWDELLENGWLKDCTMGVCGNSTTVKYPVPGMEGIYKTEDKFIAYEEAMFRVINQEALKGRLVIPEKYAGGSDEYVKYIEFETYEDYQNYHPKYPNEVLIQDVDENLTTIITPINCTCRVVASEDCATGFYCKIWNKPF